MSRDPLRAWASAAIAFVIALLATFWCWWATGAGLALFLGAVLLAALYAPALGLAVEHRRRWMVVCAITLGITACWAMSVPWTDVKLSELVRCCLVCGTFILALAGLASAFERIQLPSSVAAALTVLPALLWLTWPVWLSHALTQPLVNWLVPAHPLLAMNGVLQHLGAWDRAPIAYRQLTILNQDIAYHLPRSIVPTIVFHAAIGILPALFAFRIPAGAPSNEFFQKA